MNVAVLFGGVSAERAISILSGGQVVEALKATGHSVTAIDAATGLVAQNDLSSLVEDAKHTIDQGIDSTGVGKHCNERYSIAVFGELLGEVDVCFPVLHGSGGECGALQRLLEQWNVPYVGSSPVASACAFNKHSAKTAAQEAGILTPRWTLANTAGRATWCGDDHVVKPRSQGSSIGVQLVRSEEQLKGAVAETLRYDDSALVESFVSGRDVTVGILDGEALSPIEVSGSDDVLSYDVKYRDSDTTATPVSGDPSLEQALRRTALRAHQVLGLRHLSRIDFRVDHSRRIWFLEANSIPGLTTRSLYPQSASAAGIEFNELVERLCHLAVADASVRTGERDDD